MGFKIGYGLGLCFSKILKILWDGAVKASKRNKYLLITYVFLIVASFVSVFAIGNFYITGFIFLGLAFTSGVAEQINSIEDDNENDIDEYFRSVFEEVQLLEKDESTPNFLYSRDISEYATRYSFSTYIQISEFQKKKDLLEVYFNTKILCIKQDEENKRIIHIFAEMKELPDLLEWNDSYINRTKNSLVIGVSHYGVVEIDLQKYPHLLLCGETGSGKSNIMKCMIHQALMKKYEVTLIDFKRAVSFAEFSDKINVYCEYDETVKVLKNSVDETKERLDLFTKSRVDNLKSYNEISNNRLKRKIIFIDELAELLKIREKEIANSLYDSIETLARISRVTGIHLVLGIQRPDSTIINGQIKSNISCRLCGHFVDKEPSRIVLSNDLATKLPDVRGRFIVNVNKFQEVQCFYYNNNDIHVIDDKEIDERVKESESAISSIQDEEKRDCELSQNNEITFDFSNINK